MALAVGEAVGRRRLSGAFPSLLQPRSAPPCSHAAHSHAALPLCSCGVGQPQAHSSAVSAGPCAALGPGSVVIPVAAKYTDTKCQDALLIWALILKKNPKNSSLPVAW